MVGNIHSYILDFEQHAKQLLQKFQSFYLERGGKTLVLGNAHGCTSEKDSYFSLQGTTSVLVTEDGMCTAYEPVYSHSQ